LDNVFLKSLYFFSNRKYDFYALINNSIYKDLLFLIRNRYISIDYIDILYDVYLEKTIFYGEENEANISIRLIN